MLQKTVPFSPDQCGFWVLCLLVHIDCSILSSDCHMMLLPNLLILTLGTQLPTSVSEVPQWEQTPAGGQSSSSLLISWLPVLPWVSSHISDVFLPKLEKKEVQRCTPLWMRGLAPQLGRFCGWSLCDKSPDQLVPQSYFLWLCFILSCTLLYFILFSLARSAVFLSS